MSKHLITLIISFCLIMLGIVLTISEVINLNISDKFNDKSLSTKKDTYSFQTNNHQTYIDATFTKDPTIIYDNNIKAGNIEVVVNYLNDLVTIDKYSNINNDENTIYISANVIDGYTTFKNLCQITFNGLKKQEVYNYAEALKPNITIYINDSDRNNVKIRN